MTIKNLALGVGIWLATAIDGFLQHELLRTYQQAPSAVSVTLQKGQNCGQQLVHCCTLSLCHLGSKIGYRVVTPFTGL